MYRMKAISSPIEMNFKGLLPESSTRIKQSIKRCFISLKYLKLFCSGLLVLPKKPISTSKGKLDWTICSGNFSPRNFSHFFYFLIVVESVWRQRERMQRMNEMALAQHQLIRRLCVLYEEGNNRATGTSATMLNTKQQQIRMGDVKFN